MFKKFFTLTLGLLTAASALPLAAQIIKPAAPLAQPTTLDKAYTATLLGSAALGTAIYAYAHIKERQARLARTNQNVISYNNPTDNVAFYNNLKHTAIGLPLLVMFAPAAAYICAAPWKGLHYTASTVYHVCHNTNWHGISQAAQSLIAKFAQK